MNIDKEQFDVLEQYMEVFEKDHQHQSFRIFTPVSKNKSIGNVNSLRRLLMLNFEASSRVKKIYVSNIKSLKKNEIDLSNLNIIAGINSIGKSTLLESMALLPRYLDSELNIIPLGDDKFGNKHFKNFISNDIELDEHSLISIVYDNIVGENIIGEVKLSFTFDDSLRDVIPGLTKAGRAMEIKHMNYLPIKSVSLEVLQDPEKVSELDNIKPVNARITLQKNYKSYEKKSYDLGSHIEKNRIYGSADVKNNLHKEFQNKYDLNDDYVFTVSVNTFDELNKKIHNQVSLHNVNFDKFNYRLSKKTIKKEISIKKYGFETTGEYLLDGNIAIEISKYLRLLILDIIASENNNLKDSDQIRKEFKKIFWSMLNETTNKQLDKEKISEFIKFAEKIAHTDKQDISSDLYSQLRTNSTFTFLLGLRAQAYSLFYQSFRNQERYGSPLNFNEKLKGGIHFRGIFDACTIKDFDPTLVKFQIGDVIDTDILDLWFQDKFEYSEIVKIVDNVLQKIIDKQKDINSSELVTNTFQKLFGNYDSFLKQCSEYIDSYSERIKNEDFENAKKHIDEFVDKVTHQLKKDNVNFPFTSGLHDKIGEDFNNYTLRDLILMKIGHQNYTEDDILVPLYRLRDDKLPNFLASFFNQRNEEQSDISSVPIFKAIENFKNIQFLGPLRDRGDSTKLFYKNEKPFTLGIFGEYSKIFLKDNALIKREFITPKLFDEKLVNKIIKNNDMQKLDLEKKLSILKKENIISEMTYLDFVSQWGKYIGICEKFEINNESDSPAVFVVDSTGNKVDIVNVGIGVSQVLPVIIICSNAEIQRSKYSQTDQSIILLEQPELHLHPKAQAKLADFILANSLKDSIVLETHSEYTLNRLRYRYAQFTSFFENHISINYVKKDKNNNPNFEKILINEEGGLNAYPEDFFDQSQLQAQDFIKLKISKTGKK